MDNSKPRDIAFNMNVAAGGKAVEIRLRSPKVVTFEDGHPFLVLSDRNMAPALNALREKKLPPDRGPYADNDKEEVAKVGWEMRKAGSSVEEQAMWLIDVVVPRVIINDEGAALVTIPEERSHSKFEFAIDIRGDTAREGDELITPGNLIRQPRLRLYGSDYVHALFSEELANFATAVMRSAGREAYPVMLLGPEMHHDGVAVFPDEETIMTFFFDRTHPPVFGLNVLSDHATMSILWLRNAEQRMRRELGLIGEAMEKGMVSEEFIDKTMRIMKRKAAVAAEYLEENPELPAFLSAVESSRVDGKALLHARGVAGKLQELELEIAGNGRIAKKGFFGKGKGMPEADVVERVKGIIDYLGLGFDRYGGQNERLMMAVSMLAELIRVKLPGYGFSQDGSAELHKYVAQRLNRKPEPVEERLRVAAEIEWLDIRQEVRAGMIQGELDDLHKELAEQGMQLGELESGVKGIIDTLAEGYGDLGIGSKPLRAVNASLKAFVTETLPAYGVPQDAVVRLSAYAGLKLNPANIKKTG